MSLEIDIIIVDRKDKPVDGSTGESRGRATVPKAVVLERGLHRGLRPDHVHKGVVRALGRTNYLLKKETTRKIRGTALTRALATWS